MYTLGSGGGVRIGGGIQVSDYSVCMSCRWRGDGTALCAVEVWVGGSCGGVENAKCVILFFLMCVFRHATDIS